MTKSAGTVKPEPSRPSNDAAQAAAAHKHRLESKHASSNRHHSPAAHSAPPRTYRVRAQSPLPCLPHPVVDVLLDNCARKSFCSSFITFSRRSEIVLESGASVRGVLLRNEDIAPP